MYRPVVLYPVCFVNEPTKFVMLTAKQIKAVLSGNMLNSGLDLDTYMLLKDPDWPTN